MIKAIQVGYSYVSFKIVDELSDDTVKRVPDVSPGGVSYGIWSPQRLIADLISFEEDSMYEGPYDSNPLTYYMVNSDVFWDIKKELEERRAWRAQKEDEKAYEINQF